MNDAINALWYLIAATLLILGLKRLNSPATARRGHTLSAVGVLIAVLATLADRSMLSYGAIWTGVLLGAAAGVWLARWTGVALVRVARVVALVNGFGGGAALLVACDAYGMIVHTGAPAPLVVLLPLQLAVLLGGVTLAAGITIWARLDGRVANQPRHYRFQGQGIWFLAAVTLILMAYLSTSPDHPWWQALAVIMTLKFGVLAMLRAEAEDMGNAIILLNAGAGLAAAAIGFALEFQGLVLAGALASASSLTLTAASARAARRPLVNLLASAFAPSQVPQPPTASGSPVESASGTAGAA